MHASNEFGPELRRRRLAAGLTLTRLAELLSYSKGHLSKIERGHKTPPFDLARRCDAQLAAGGELERLVPSESPERGTGVDGAATDDEAWLLRVGRDGVRWPGGLGRRQLLTAGATSLLGAGVATAAGAAGPAAAAVLGGTGAGVGAGAGAEPSGDSSPVGIFRAQFDQMRRLGQTTDPGMLLPLLTVQTHTLRELAVQADASSRPRLLGLAARYAEYAGWMAQESGDNPSALWWTARAVELAEAGGDRDLASYALVRRALVTFYAGDADQTVQLVAQAQGGHLPPRIRGLAAQREAQGHALAGDHTASLRSLDRARELLARAAAEDGPVAPVLGTTNLVDPAAMVTGWCLYDLGRPAQAAEVLDHEYTRIPPHAVRSRSRYGLRRALAHAATGEAEHACTLAAELLPLVPALRSATIRTDVERLARELARFRANRAVLDLQPALAKALHP
ncbi:MULTISPECIES: helix-turn-helix domain-containing protein [unclassified Kitasatospora]|uniref:helix-turn-helix domain-containing protein n=1 Tax=unclassified Kitasatospora TaxID=2633591 RepID=UPI003802FD46